ncbi:MAG: flagellar biosynthesis protein FlhF [Planctomycetota bacterium]
MSIRTYRARSAAEALAKVKDDLGRDAVILHTRTEKSGGVFGIGQHTIIEITATSGEQFERSRPAPPPRRDRSVAAPPVPQAVLGPAARSPVSPPTHETISSNSAPLPVTPSQVEDEPLRRAVREVAEFAVREPKPVSAPPVSAPTPPTGFAEARPASDPQADVADELAAIRRMVGHVLQSQRGAHQAGMPDGLFHQYMALLEGEVAGEIADQIVAGVRDELTIAELDEPETVARCVHRRLVGLIPVCSTPPTPERGPDGRPLTIALVGPTGVGKTTTIAKLAATYRLRRGRSVGLITCDTYRIAAVEQLRTYANILGVELRVVMSPDEMKRACAELCDREVVLIDTAGRSPSDESKLAELARFLKAARPHRTHLVLSAAGSQKALERAAERFDAVCPDHLILTKLDEAASFGLVLNIVHRLGVSLSYVTTGQEVPDHIEPANADRLAELVLGERRVS